MAVESTVKARQIRVEISTGSKSYGMHSKGPCEEEYQ